MDIETYHHELQLRDVVAAIHDGRPPAVTGEDGWRTVQLIAAIYQAAGSGQRVPLPARDA